MQHVNVDVEMGRLKAMMPTSGSWQQQQQQRRRDGREWMMVHLLDEKRVQPRDGLVAEVEVVGGAWTSVVDRRRRWRTEDDDEEAAEGTTRRCMMAGLQRQRRERERRKWERRVRRWR